tara:strand:- start:1121 stop:1447 length:327 start_codon:yes stop_codon:yes gene_type:complete
MPEDKKQDTAKTEAPAEAPTGAPADAGNPDAGTSLTVADLRNLRTIIDVASSRGAFRGAELKGVGEAFEKLDTFVKAIDAKAQAEAQATTGDAPADAKKEEEQKTDKK